MSKVLNLVVSDVCHIICSSNLCLEMSISVLLTYYNLT